MQERNCTNCRHYRPMHDEGKVLDYGECRRLPPSVAVVSDELLSAYPQVDANDDCAEWKAPQ